MMRNSLCLLADNATASWGHILPALTGCGLDLWTAKSAEACLSDRRSNEMLCLIVDLPFERAETCLEILRSSKVRSPAILIADPEEVRLRRSNADWIDILERPVSIRLLLEWVECVCTAHIALQRARSLPGLFPRAA